MRFFGKTHICEPDMDRAERHVVMQRGFFGMFLPAKPEKFFVAAPCKSCQRQVAVSDITACQLHAILKRELAKTKP
jgi:hypothetical protein